MSPVVDAVVLAGGAGRRLGGVSKGEVELAGRRLVDRVLVATGPARQVVVVGDLPVPAGVLLTREDPPGGGPAAGVAAGLDRLTAQSVVPADWVLVLACDLPGAVDVVPQVLAALDDASAPAAVVPVDGTGRPQWLLAAYRHDALRGAVDALGDPRDCSVRALVGGLNRHEVRPDPRHVEDVDTWSDHTRWASRLQERSTP